MQVTLKEQNEMAVELRTKYDIGPVELAYVVFFVTNELDLPKDKAIELGSLVIGTSIGIKKDILEIIQGVRDQIANRKAAIMSLRN